MTGFLLALILMPIFLYSVLRTSMVQTYLSQRFAEYLSDELETSVSIKGVDISWFMQLALTGVEVSDRQNEPLLSVNKISLKVKKLNIRKRVLVLSSLKLKEADFNLKYDPAQEALNLQFILDYFASTDTTPSEPRPWLLKCKRLQLSGSHFSYNDERNHRPGKGMDFSDLDISDLNLDIRGIEIAGDTILADIRHLTAREKSGLSILGFSALAMVSPEGIVADSLKILTDKSDLNLDFSMQYDSWRAFSDFIDSVRITANLRSTRLDMRDIVCFAPEIDGMDEIFNLSGKVRGTIASFSGKNMDISFGDSTRFKGMFRLNGLPDVEETFVQLKMEDFRTHVSDLEHFTLPYKSGIAKVEVPGELARLGMIKIKGRFTGFYNDFVSKATFRTDAGSITTDILLSNNRETRTIEYNGRLQAEGFQLGKVFQLKELGGITLDVAIDGQGFTAEKADFTLKGNASQVGFMNNSLDMLTIDGGYREKRFKGILNLHDELAKMHFDGSIDFSDSLPAFDFKADIENAMLSGLNLWDRDRSSNLTTHMDLNFTGNNLDNLLGSLLFSNTRYLESGKVLQMKQLSLQTTRLPGSGKRMTLASDYADATFSGQYTFEDLAEYMTFIFTDYLPALSFVTPSDQRKTKGSFDYTIQLRNTAPLTAIFLPQLTIDPNTVISGGFDPASGLISVTGRSPLIRMNDFFMKDWTLLGSSSNGALQVDMNCRSVNFHPGNDKDLPLATLEQFRLATNTRNDSVHFSLFWNDPDSIDHNKAMLGGSLSFSAYPRLVIGLDPSDFLIDDTLWQLKPGSEITIDSNSIQIRGFSFESSHQAIAAEGSISADPLDQMKVDFTNFNLSQFDRFYQSWGIDLDGYLNGTLSFSDVYHVPLVLASLVVEKIGFNQETLGDAVISSSWDNTQKAIGLDTKIAYRGTAGLHHPLFVKGWIFTQQEHDNLDLDIKVDNIKIKTMQPFFKGLFSKMKGWASGDLKLQGDFSHPSLTGQVRLMRTELLVDYLRTSYSFSGDLNFGKDLIWFKDIALADSVGNTGSSSGRIQHKGFKDWVLDIMLNSKDLYVLNTSFSANEMYYGKARAEGKMHLTGPVNDLKLEVEALSGRGTEIFIPISYAVDISETDYIRYINPDSTSMLTEPPGASQSNINLELALDITRDAAIEIILPYRMGKIKVRGDGIIDLGIDTRGDYSMHGQYIMDKGSFLFNLQDILNRNFEIQKGSTITFNGSPDDADINLRAVYKIKTNLSGLSSVPTEIASRRIPVDCVVELRNSLYNPDIQFRISMPEVDAETQRWVYGAIDTSNAVIMNQQMISLLVLNSFTSTGESMGISSTGIGASSFGIISSQLNNWLSSISKTFDIGVNYRPGDQMTAQELELALSTQLFNDRVVIDGAFGMSSHSTAGSNPNANQLIGDMNVEVKITEDGRFRVKAFNRTNTSLDLYSGQSPYTQGVGILYRKDFDSFRDLFRKQRKAIVPD